MTAGNVVAGIFGYAFMAMAARGLWPRQFGSLGVLLSAFYLASALTSAINTLVSRNVAEAKALNPQADITHLVRSPLLTVGLYSAIILGAYAMLSSRLNAWLNIQSLPAVMLLGLFCAITALNATLRGGLQGLHHFGVVALVTSFEALSRLLTGLVWCQPRWSLTNTLLAYLFAASICLPLTLPLIPLQWRRFIAPAQPRAGIRTSRRAYATALVFVAFAVMTQTDMVAAKLCLSAEDAGYYAAACNFVKTPFLLVGGSLASVMFPALVGIRARAGSGTRLSCIGLLTVAVCLGGITIVFASLPRLAISALLGDAFLPLAPWLGLFCVAACAPGVLAVTMRSALLTNMRLLLVALFAGVGAEATVLLISHRTPVSFCAALGSGGAVALAILLAAQLCGRRLSTVSSRLAAEAK